VTTEAHEDIDNVTVSRCRPQRVRSLGSLEGHQTILASTWSEVA